MVTSIWIVLVMTIEPLWSPWWTLPFPPNLVLYIVHYQMSRTLHFEVFGLPICYYTDLDEVKSDRA